MTVDEVRVTKESVEKEILKILRNLEEVTECKVEDINIDHRKVTYLSYSGGYESRGIRKVVINLKVGD